MQGEEVLQGEELLRPWRDAPRGRGPVLRGWEVVSADTVNPERERFVLTTYLSESTPSST